MRHGRRYSEAVTVWAALTTPLQQEGLTDAPAMRAASTYPGRQPTDEGRKKQARHDGQEGDVCKPEPLMMAAEAVVPPDRWRR